MENTPENVLPPVSRHFVPSSASSISDVICTAPEWDDVLPIEIAEKFEKHGVVLLRKFASSDEVAAMRTEMRDVLIPLWNPDDDPCGFTTMADEAGAQIDQDAFLQASIDKIQFFMEPEMVTRHDAPKAERINKVGHALHYRNAVFEEFSQSKKVANIVHRLGKSDPILPQSMYIYKQKQPYGSPVTIHQDSTFLYTEPSQSCIGIWVPLDACDETNGCLWARLGSHKEPLRRRFARNADPSGPKHTMTTFFTEDGSFVPGGEVADNKWDGKDPTDEMIRASGFLAVPMQAGDALIFSGLLDHMSKANMSSQNRDTFQLHLVEGPGAGVTWSDKNWMQPASVPFPLLRFSKEMRIRYNQPSSERPKDH